MRGGGVARSSLSMLRKLWCAAHVGLLYGRRVVALIKKLIGLPWQFVSRNWANSACVIYIRATELDTISPRRYILARKLRGIGERKTMSCLYVPEDGLFSYIRICVFGNLSPYIHRVCKIRIEIVYTITRLKTKCSRAIKNEHTK